MMDIIERTLTELAHLQSAKSSMSTFWQEVTDYVLPDRSDVTRFAEPGARRGVTRYDSTAVEAAEILAGNMSATLTPQSLVWLALGLANEELNTKQRVRDWCEDCRDIILQALAKSNFYLAMDEVYLDLVGFATAAPYTELVDGRLSFSAWPVREYAFTVGADGRARDVYREFKQTPMQIFERFARHPGLREMGRTVEEALRPGAAPEAKHAPVRVVHVIRPRDDYDPRRKDARNMPIASLYINADDRTVIAEGGYHEMPVSITRWRVTSDDAGWGRGPAWTAMPDIRSLNEARRMIHKAAAKDLDPPLVIDNKGVIGSVRTGPSGITYVRPGARLEPLQSGNRMDMTMFETEALRSQIRSCFYADHLRLPPPQAQPMTATEIQIRWELMERLLGPTLGRLQVELLNPIIERVFGLMMRAGQLPEPPEEVLEAEMNIEYMGPLARAQQMPDIVAIERAYQTAGNIATLTGDPSPLDNLDADAAIRRAAILQGVPAEVLRDEEAVAEMRQQRAEQQAELAAKQDAALAADVAAKAGKVAA